MASIRKTYEALAKRVDEKDGLGFDFDDWRFNIRKSNTELLIRLNVEVHGDWDLVRNNVSNILKLIA